MPAMCLVTATFLSADGTPLQGVLVRFTPRTRGTLVQGAFMGGEINAESDEDGEIEFSVVQGAQGILAVSALPLFREVTVPEEATADLWELVAAAPDPLAPAEYEPTDLPRRS